MSAQGVDALKKVQPDTVIMTVSKRIAELEEEIAHIICEQGTHRIDEIFVKEMERKAQLEQELNELRSKPLDALWLFCIADDIMIRDANLENSATGG